MLEANGKSQTRLEAQWKTKFQELQKMVLDHSEKGSQHDGKILTQKVLGRPMYDWLANQRCIAARGNLDPKWRELLDGLGIDWTGVDEMRG
jgi:hypothetical protein